MTIESRLAALERWFPQQKGHNRKQETTDSDIVRRIEVLEAAAHPGEHDHGDDDAAVIAGLVADVRALVARVAELEAAPPAGGGTVDLTALTARVVRTEKLLEAGGAPFPTAGSPYFDNVHIKPGGKLIHHVTSAKPYSEHRWVDDEESDPDLKVIGQYVIHLAGALHGNGRSEQSVHASTYTRDTSNGAGRKGWWDMDGATEQNGWKPTAHMEHGRLSLEDGSELLIEYADGHYRLDRGSDGKPVLTKVPSPPKD